MTPAVLALSLALAWELSGNGPANDNGQRRDGLRSTSSSADETSSAPASLSTTSSVAEASPLSNRQRCDLPMPARSATWVSAIPLSAATVLNRRASTARNDALPTYGSVPVATPERFPYQGIVAIEHVGRDR